jgi:hypothetical protein
MALSTMVLYASSAVHSMQLIEQCPVTCCILVMCESAGQSRLQGLHLVLDSTVLCLSAALQELHKRLHLSDPILHVDRWQLH